MLRISIFASFNDFFYWILDQFQQCAIFGTFSTVCYFFNRSNRVLFVDQFPQCALLGTVHAVCYFWNSSDIVFFFHCMTSLILITLTNIPSAALLYSSVLNDKIIWLFSVNIRAFQTLSIILISCYIRNEYAIATSDKAVFRNAKEINVIDQNVQ